ncbi:MAG: GMC family oxidoreductase [Myxococcaceae bacterium]
MNTSTKTVQYDAIVIGSGATGGTAAKQLCEAGAKTLVLEAGRHFKGGSEYGTQATNMVRALWDHFIENRQPIQKLHGGYWEVNPSLFVDDVQNPYTTPPDKPYRWIRGRQVGGRSLTWGGVTLRLSDHEFKGASRDGIGEDWPIGHDDLAPYYSMLENFFQVHGSREGLLQQPDGDFLPACELSPGERVLKAAVETKFPGRRVLPSRGIRAARHPAKGDKYSKLSSPGTTLAAAQATGNLTLQSDAICRRLLVDPNTGRATGVEYIDRELKQRHQVFGKTVFLCASTIESLRILMNSKSPTHPDGIGASSGVLGRYLMDHIVGNIYFYMPEVAEDGRTWELLGSDSIVIPRFVNLGDGGEAYARGFGMWGGVHRLPFPAMLKKKGDVAFGFLCAMGEAIPHADNTVRLDEKVVDDWGIPVPHISSAWTPNDLAVARAARNAAVEMIEAAGGVVAPLNELVRTPVIEKFMGEMQKEWVVTTPGLFVHEVGGARMGATPKGSVVNPFCQVWDAPNVFVTDGACWVSSGWQNPTLTEMAITARACEFAVGELKRGNL